MSRKKNILPLAVGILVGMAMSGPAAHAAVDYLQALPSTNAIYLDGQQIQMEAYAINGNNYVKLRDSGEAVGFNVYWADGVQIDSDAPYTGEKPEEEKTITEVTEVVAPNEKGHGGASGGPAAIWSPAGTPQEFS